MADLMLTGGSSATIVERNLIISLLKLTKSGPILAEYVKDDCRIPSETMRELLEKLQYEGLIYLTENLVGTDTASRIGLSIKAISLGLDIEQVANSLSWREFEEIAAIALERNGYAVKKNLRFRFKDRKWEIDVVGCRKPIVLCIDCKHWHRTMSRLSVKKIVAAQTERAGALANSLPSIALKIDCAQWNRARFVPAVIALLPNGPRFCNGVPIVPVLQLQDFVHQLPLYSPSLRCFKRNFDHLDSNHH